MKVFTEAVGVLCQLARPLDNSVFQIVFPSANNCDVIAVRQEQSYLTLAFLKGHWAKRGEF